MNTVTYLIGGIVLILGYPVLCMGKRLSEPRKDVIDELIVYLSLLWAGIYGLSPDIGFWGSLLAAGGTIGLARFIYCKYIGRGFFESRWDYLVRKERE